MKKLLVVLLLSGAVALFQFIGRQHSSTPATSSPTLRQGNSGLTHAFENHADGVQVEGQGTVVKVLRDDNEGSRHQRFIIRVDDGNTLLIAHNIDLAPRVSPLSEGDTVSFSGEYAWNSKGGVVHWTHHDPKGLHAAGWIRHDGQVFQ